MTLWTDSVDTRQAPTLGPRLVRSLSHLTQVYDVGLSVPRVDLVKNTGVETLPTALRHSGLVRHDADRHRSETSGNVGIEHEAEGPFTGFRSIWNIWNPIHQVSPRVGPGTEALGQQTRWMPASSSTP